MARAARRRAAAVATALCCATIAGCAIRYDGSGVTRVGVGLWGWGDPPGVEWNLDWPRREIPELPRTAPPELPPRPPARPELPLSPDRAVGAGPAAAIDDNPDRDARCDLRSPTAAVAARARAGCGGFDR